MADKGYPVTVAVTRPNGEVEEVRVGTAVKSGDGFTLRLGEMTIGGTAVASPAPARRRAPAAAEGMVFPPYGRSKGQPIAGASLQDLEFYASGARRTLSDPGKARWHEKERALLAAIEAEIARQKGGGSPPGKSASPPEDDVPPPGDDDLPF